MTAIGLVASASVKRKNKGNDGVSCGITLVPEHQSIKKKKKKERKQERNKERNKERKKRKKERDMTLTCRFTIHEGKNMC